eukprot:1744903-Rhodomonas_salina.3
MMLREVLARAVVLRLRYAMSGTDLAQIFLYYSSHFRGKLCYLPTRARRCPVLRWRMALPAAYEAWPEVAISYLASYGLARRCPEAEKKHDNEMTVPPTRTLRDVQY